MNAPGKIAELIFRYLRNELSESQQRELDEWRSTSPENERLFREETDMEKIRLRLKEMYDSEDMVWQKILEGAPHIAVHPPRKTVFLRFWPAAAILLILLGFGWYHLKYSASESRSLADTNKVEKQQDILPGGNHAMLTLANGSTIILDTVKNGFFLSQGVSDVLKQDSGELSYRLRPGGEGGGTKPEYNMLRTPRGGEFRLVLPDGSKVWLNAASSLRYPTAFSQKERRVELTGEGYFEVAKSLVPFYVVVNGNTRVEVLGTQFNIMGYSDEPAITTTLLEGKVKVSQGAQGRIIKPGEQAKIIQDSIRVIQGADVENAISWKNGRIFFRDADIQTIMRMISRWYNVDIEFRGEIAKRSITGGISRNANLSELIRILELNKINLSIKGKTITITP